MALLRGALLCGVLLAVEHAAAFAPPAGLISGQGRGNMGARQTKDAAVPPRHFSAGRRVFMMNAAKDPVDETSSQAKLKLEALSKSASVNLDAAIADAKSAQAPTDAGREAGVGSDSTDETREEKLARAQKMIEKVRGSGSAGGGGQDGQPKKTSSGIGGTWTPEDATEVQSHKPARASWGVFERPADISKAFGGGRKIGVDGYKPSEEEMEASRRATLAKLSEYQKSVGVDRRLEEEHKDEIDQALAEYDAWMGKVGRERPIEDMTRARTRAHTHKHTHPHSHAYAMAGADGEGH